MKVPRTSWMFGTLALLLLLGGASIYLLGGTSGPLPGIQGAAYQEPSPVPAFELVDHHGQVFAPQDLVGRWTLLYFGYTFCPDVCPTTLQTLGALQQHLDRQGSGGKVDVLFVSVDPSRDTPERLGQYARFFGPRIRAATGEAGELASLTEALGVVYARVGEPGDPNYLIDHTSAVLLIDPQARLYAVMTAPHTVERLATDLEAIRQHYQ